MSPAALRAAESTSPAQGPVAGDGLGALAADVAGLAGASPGLGALERAGALEGAGAPEGAGASAEVTANVMFVGVGVPEHASESESATKPTTRARTPNGGSGHLMGATLVHAYRRFNGRGGARVPRVRRDEGDSTRARAVGS
ncbi:MAG: hypothetical protein QM820_59380 [Minicystis sp.]